MVCPGPQDGRRRRNHVAMAEMSVALKILGQYFGSFCNNI